MNSGTEDWYIGSVTFDGEFRGAITTSENLDTSNSVSSLQTDSLHGERRGLENFIPSADYWVEWDSNSLTLNFQGQILTVFDEFPVITSSVPGPGAFCILAGGGWSLLMHSPKPKRLNNAGPPETHQSVQSFHPRMST